jgi:hypothetical protein
MSEGPTKQETKLIKLEVVLNPDNGNLTVSGPVGNKDLCWDMLFQAMKVVARHIPLEIVGGGNGKGIH